MATNGAKNARHIVTVARVGNNICKYLQMARNAQFHNALQLMAMFNSRFDDDRDEFTRWNETFSGGEFFYGHEPGPLARRTIRYARAVQNSGTAIDLGCGEGQDLAFLAQCGYESTGLEWTPNGVEKTRRLLREANLSAQVLALDLRHWKPTQTYDLLIAVNSLQFVGEEASEVLDVALNAVAPKGFIGLSFWAREDGQSAVEDGVWLPTKNELLRRMKKWQPCEVADLWQWNSEVASRRFVTIVAQRK